MSVATEVNLGRYEGLVFRTSTMYEGRLGMEREDLQQILRLCVWRAATSYEVSRDERGSIDTFVFWCLRNQIKDLVKAKIRRDRHGRQVYIEDLDDELRQEDEAERDGVPLPKTLSGSEREVVAYLYLGYRQTEIATMMSCPRREIERRVRSIRRKMADWRPSLTMGNGEVVELEAQVKRGIRRVAA
jgi:RNA polymerase sigma factor (sigma-70 family)